MLMSKNHNSVSLRCWVGMGMVAGILLMLAGTAGAALYQLGDSGWSAAVNPEWEISFSVDQLTERTVIIEIQKRFIIAARRSYQLINN